jgi:ankyrin repeat protein
MCTYSSVVAGYLSGLRPGSLLWTTHVGTAPLHYAARHPHVTPTLRLLVERCPDALNRTGTGPSILPLQIAVGSRSPSLDVVKFLVERSPETLLRKDSDGSVPLHTAVSATTCLFELVRYLVDRMPASVQVRDGDGLLPFEVAAASGAPLGVICYLFRKWPSSLHRQPLHS